MWTNSLLLSNLKEAQSVTYRSVSAWHVHKVFNSALRSCVCTLWETWLACVWVQRQHHQAAGLLHHTSSKCCWHSVTQTCRMHIHTNMLDLRGWSLPAVLGWCWCLIPTCSADTGAWESQRWCSPLYNALVVFVHSPQFWKTTTNVIECNSHEIISRDWYNTKINLFMNKLFVWHEPNKLEFVNVNTLINVGLVPLLPAGFLCHCVVVDWWKLRTCSAGLQRVSNLGG